ncbi:MAG: 4-hydroxy-2-oxovalerate aldolase [Burkholderiaceae bacterium]|nr:4-hydroxy-2-oxovalerate aldolase [Burkholderiaceae bacterium]
MSKVTIVDVTLRDGNHTYGHQFTPEIVAKTAAALDRAGVDYIEVGHGDGLGGSCIHVGRSATSDMELIKAAVGAVKNAKISIILIPGMGSFQDLEMSAELGVSMARIGTHCTEADITEQHLQRAADLGLLPVGYLVSVGMASAERLASEAAKMESYGAQYINLAESQGHLVPSEVAERIRAVRKAVKIPIGFHPHNNLGLAIGNILAALGEGATFIDGSLKGFGGGAGNAQTEVAVAALKKAGYDINPTLFETLDAADVFQSMVQPHPMPSLDNDSILMGFANVYGGYVLPVKKAASEYGCDPRELILRLGARRVVHAQEDAVIDEAQKLVSESRSVPEVTV